MAFAIRRIVTGHNAAGRAVVLEDSEVPSQPGVMTPEVGNVGLWATTTMPVDCTGSPDAAQQEQRTLTPGPSGSIFRILELPPGIPPRMHRTETIDYVIVLEGEVDMVLDDGAEVHMNTGDTMIQRATNHGWTNRTSKPARIAFILIDANTSGAPASH